MCGMKVIQVRNVPDDVHQTLRTRAAQAGMSLSDYVLDELVRVADRPVVADVLARSSRRTSGIATNAIVEAVRSGRDR